MARITLKRLFYAMCTAGIVGLSSTQAIASGFQLYEQDAAGVANYHAGRAALATDASIQFYNPAGITRIKNQQLVVGAVPILTDVKYRGTVTSNTFLGGLFPQQVNAQGGSFSTIPNLYYVAPLGCNVGLGIGVNVPFGLETNYGRNTALSWNSTKTFLKVVDISPSLGFKITDKFSAGLGVDAQIMHADFNLVGVLKTSPFGSTLTADARNKADDTAYGYHLGLLYEFSPATRIGAAYHSQVVHHLKGDSKFIGPLNSVPIIGSKGQALTSSNTRTNITLPPYTALSLYHMFNPCWALMGTAMFTQWSTFKYLKIRNVAAIAPVAGLPVPLSQTNVVVNIPTHYRNSWNFALGADYYATEKLIVRGGVGYDKSPVPSHFRNVEVPDNNRYAVALGGHYQAVKCVGVDVGWTHLFVPRARINPPTQVVGSQQVNTDGHSTGSADLFGVQFTWDIT